MNWIQKWMLQSLRPCDRALFHLGEGLSGGILLQCIISIEVLCEYTTYSHLSVEQWEEERSQVNYLLV